MRSLGAVVLVCAACAAPSERVAEPAPLPAVAASAAPARVPEVEPARDSGTDRARPPRTAILDATAAVFGGTAYFGADGLVGQDGNPDKWRKGDTIAMVSGGALIGLGLALVIVGRGEKKESSQVSWSLTTPAAATQFATNSGNK